MWPTPPFQGGRPLLNLANLPAPDTLDGEALLKMCKGREALVKERIRVSQRSKGHAVIALGPSKAGKSTIVQVKHLLCLSRFRL